MQSNAKTILSGIYATQMTFITEWDVGTHNLKQMGYSQIGEAYYRAGWHTSDHVALGINVNVTTRPASGIYNGPLATDIEDVNTEKMGFAFAPGALSLNPNIGITPRMKIHGNCLCTGCATSTTCNPSTVTRGVCDKTPNTATGSCDYIPGGISNGSEVTFVIFAIGNIGGSTYDAWSIRESKFLVNEANGAN